MFYVAETMTSISKILIELRQIKILLQISSSFSELLFYFLMIKSENFVTPLKHSFASVLTLLLSG